MTRPRIVITGLGGISALGTDAPTIWHAMKTGINGIAPIDIPEKDRLKARLAAQVRELPDHGFERRLLLTTSRFGLLAMIAAKEALADSGLIEHGLDPLRTGAIIGTGIFGGDVIDTNYKAILLENKKRTDIFLVPQAMPSSPAVHVSMAFGLKGPVYGTSSACSSANHAFASALDTLRAGRADVMVAGGSDAPLNFGVLKAWDSMRILSRNGCRPFSADRDGLVLGDGAGAVVLETEDHARARGATILAELAGAGLTADAGDIVAPDVDGAARAMEQCLTDAGLAPDDVQYVNAHGTGTMGNDKTETQAIRRAFGSHADALAVSSTKSMHGHCMGASGALEMIAAVGAVRDGILPPTLGYENPDPDCDLDYVPNEPRKADVAAVVSNSFAFGGSNAVIAVKRA
ncbi:MAG: beta-ketoacyl-[acyl-carrier-protein] synthase family protein [Roseitalea sp.]|nr:beta-ketoacyl-[acyl-carrier-protein] synthase family protein [Roseitalea sp.]MBO6720916.1 beta-ketoacyl-[acyl-carrier-protein] synthase family protein [Roseitalea sp.]MBO6743221.1 beta-ketoacyl-[acyl-carrier-protein] synthase family protein [Roseitalea sp.]